MRRIIATLTALVALSPAVLAQQQWGTWSPGRGAFGDWHWASPLADEAAINLLTGAPGECIAAMDTGLVYCWSGDISDWVASGGAAGNSFATINPSSGTSPVADSATDTLNVTAGAGITVTGNDSTDTLTIATTVVDTDTDDQTAAEVPYDPTASGLAATDVQAAVDELAAAPGGDVVGPASSMAHAFALFADTTGKLLEASDWSILSGTLTAPSGGNVLLPGNGKLYLNSATTGLKIANGEVGQLSGSLVIYASAGGDLSIGGGAETVYLGGSSSQPVIGTGAFDFRDSKLRIPNGNTAALPATCAGGQQYVNTQTGLHCDCTATNTWTCGAAATAATATALATNGTNCSAGNYPLGVDASGNAESCTAASGGGIGGSTGGVDNRILRSDGTGGATVQNSTLGLSDTGKISLPDDAGSRASGSTTANTIRFYGAGSDFYLYNDGSQFNLRDDGGTTWLFASGRIYLPTNGDYRFTGSDIAFGYEASGVGKIYNPAGGSYAALKLDNVRLAPRGAPPVTCGSANTEGTFYTDTSHALCYCDGTAWVVITGAGSCA